MKIFNLKYDFFAPSLSLFKYDVSEGRGRGGGCDPNYAGVMLEHLLNFDNSYL